MGFLKDLDRSKVGVEVVKKYYKTLPLSELEIEELGKEFQHRGDLSISYKNGTDSRAFCDIEVKFDMMGAKTGNLCFEVSNGSKPTGIMKTSADYIAYVVPNGEAYKLFLFNLADLKTYISSSPKSKLKRGGDKKKFSMYIVSVLDILEDKVCFLSEDVSAL